MIIYIAGRITGDPNYKVKFDKAAKRLSAKGHVVLTPSMLPLGLDYDDYMHIDFAMIDVADTVYFLKDYKQSNGAMKEWAYAILVNKEIMYER